MASIYTKKFGSHTQSGAGSATLYTAPSGVTSVVRDISIVLQGAIGSQCLVSVVGGQAITSFNPTVVFADHHWDGRAVLEVGDVLEFQCNGSSWDVSVTGYELDT